MVWIVILAMFCCVIIGFVIGALTGYGSGKQQAYAERQVYCAHHHMAIHTCNVYPHPDTKVLE